MIEKREVQRVTATGGKGVGWAIGYGGVQRIVGIGGRAFPDAFEVWMDGDQDRPAIVLNGRHVSHFESLREAR